MAEDVKMVREQIEQLHISDNPIDDFIAQLNSIKLKAAVKGYTDLRVEREYFYEDAEIWVYGERSETEEEHHRRINYDKLQAEKLLASKRRQYEILKKEFEPKATFCDMQVKKEI